MKCILYPLFIGLVWARSPPVPAEYIRGGISGPLEAAYRDVKRIKEDIIYSRSATERERHQEIHEEALGVMLTALFAEVRSVKAELARHRSLRLDEYVDSAYRCSEARKWIAQCPESDLESDCDDEVIENVIKFVYGSTDRLADCECQLVAVQRQILTSEISRRSDRNIKWHQWYLDRIHYFESRIIGLNELIDQYSSTSADE